jgi:hypothetical protein
MGFGWFHPVISFAIWARLRLGIAAGKPIVPALMTIKFEHAGVFYDDNNKSSTFFLKSFLVCVLLVLEAVRLVEGAVLKTVAGKTVSGSSPDASANQTLFTYQAGLTPK